MVRSFDDYGPYDAETCISSRRAECFEHFKFGMKSYVEFKTFFLDRGFTKEDWLNGLAEDYKSFQHSWKEVPCLVVWPYELAEWHRAELDGELDGVSSEDEEYANWT